MSTTADEPPRTGSGARSIWKTDYRRVRCIPEHTEINMDEPTSGRRKKADKAKDKRGRPSSKHVRQYQTHMASKK
jgi:hypothetical protein